MKRFFAFILTIYSVSYAYGQELVDNFDTNLPINTTKWLGEHNAFNIINEQLTLNSSTPNAKNYLSIPVITADSTNWSFDIKYLGNPSSANKMKVHLMSDNSNLLEPLHGYYLLIGESGSNDAIKLYRQNGTQSTLLATGILGNIAVQPNLRIKVTRDAVGNWSVFSDKTKSNNYSLECTAFDNTFPHSNYFGWTVHYTTSNKSNKFFFDNLHISPLHQDTTPPSLTNVITLNNKQLELTFTEKIDNITSQNINNFHLIEHPQNNVLNSAVNDNTIVLTFTDTFPAFTTLQLQIDSIADTNNNYNYNLTTPFIHYVYKQATFGDVLLNELYPDPTPSLGLPEAEFIELYNTTNYAIDLTDWTISDGSTTIALAEKTLLPNEYLILSNESSYTEYGNLLLTNIPSLNNDNDQLTLKNNNQTLIHKIQYTANNYQADHKADGGYSLEYINPDNACLQSNLLGSQSIIGATPGYKNSISDTTNHPALSIAKSNLINDSTISLTFNQTIYTDSLTFTNVNQNNITSTIKGDEITLHFTPPLLPQTIYNITLQPFQNCKNPTNEINFKIGLPDSLAQGDIIINEVLFDPFYYANDFIELYNNSNKIINLKNLIIGKQTSDEILSSFVKIEADHLLFPRTYAVLSASKNDVISDYKTKSNLQHISVNLPNFNNDADNITLLQNGNIIDQLDYTVGTHFPLLSDSEGYSLERINPDIPTQNTSNWHSAASTLKATPGYQNSQYNQFQKTSNISLSYKVISPNGDGFQDYLAITYNFEANGYVTNINIFDLDGRLIHELADNELLPTSGIIQWNGRTTDNIVPTTGVYILLVELFNLDGTMEKHKIPFTLVTE